MPSAVRGATAEPFPPTDAGRRHQFLLLRGLAVQSAADRVEEQEHDSPRHTVAGVARGPASGNRAGLQQGGAVFRRVGLGCPASAIAPELCSPLRNTSRIRNRVASPSSLKREATRVRRSSE